MPPSDRPVTAHHSEMNGFIWAALVPSVPSPQVRPLSWSSFSGATVARLSRMTLWLRSCTVTPSRLARSICSGVMPSAWVTDQRSGRIGRSLSACP